MGVVGSVSIHGDERDGWDQSREIATGGDKLSGK